MIAKQIEFTNANAEAYFQAFRNKELSTEVRFGVPKSVPYESRTPPARSVQCKVCAYESQGDLHAMLLKVHQSHSTLAQVILRTQLPEHVLKSHMRDCCDFTDRDGAHLPYSTEFVMLPIGRIRVLKVLDVIRSFPEARWIQSESESKSGRMIQHRSRTYGPREWLESLWFSGTERSTLLHNGSLRDEKSHEIAKAIQLFADKLDGLPS